MINLLSLILTLPILIGQLIKIPAGSAGGVTMLDLAVGILCLTGLFKLKFKLPYPNRIFIALIIFILIAAVSLIFTPLHLNQNQFLTSFFYLIRFASFVLLGYLIYAKAFPKLANNVYFVLIYSGIGLAILGLLQLVFIPDLMFLTQKGWDPHYFRTVSTFLDPNFTGLYLALTLLLLFNINLNSLKKWKIAVISLVYIALLTTFSRGAYLAFGVSFITLSLITKSSKLFILSIIMVIGLGLGFSMYQQAVATPRGIDRAQSASFRIDTWQQGLIVFQKAPILGVGYNTYRFAVSEYNLGSNEFSKSRGSSSNDSSLLFILATTGIIGFVSYLCFLATVLYVGFENHVRKNVAGVIIISGLTGLLLASFFSNNLFYPFILIWIMLVVSQLKD